MISPKSKRTNVSNTVMHKNSNHDAPKWKTSIRAKLLSRMMVTLMRLLEISMVARSRSDCSSSRVMIWSDEASLSVIIFLSEGDNEKKAVSEADTKAEQANSNAVSANAMMAPSDGGVTVRRGDVSNRKR